MKMHKDINFYCLATLSTALLILFFDLIFSLQSADKIIMETGVLELIIHITIITVIIQISTQLTKFEEGSLSVFCGALIYNVGLLISDYCWFIITYFHGLNLFAASDVLIYIDIFPFIVWMTGVIVCLLVVLKKHILCDNDNKIILIIMLLVSAIAIILFLYFARISNNILVTPILLQLSNFIGQIILFDLVILCLLYTEHSGFKIFLTGIIGTITGYAFFIYAGVSHSTTGYIQGYGEMFWFLGLLLNLAGLLKIKNTNDYKIASWVRKNSAIKSQFAFWYYILSISSFLLLFIVLACFSIIRPVMFLGLPLFLTLYSTIMIFISLYLGRHFELPFIKISGNIRLLLDYQQIEKTKFSTDEFNFLQDTITDSITHRIEADKMKHEFGVLAADVAHDLKSPLLGLMLAVNTIRHDMSASNITKNINVIELLAREVRNISANMIDAYYQITDSSEKKLTQKSSEHANARASFVLLSDLLQNIINIKRLEWQNVCCRIELVQMPTTELCWCFVSAVNVSRSISNLLNNAFQSMITNQAQIIVRLTRSNNFLAITIQDNGCGIPNEKITAILSGQSSKHVGKGIGLPFAVKYFNSIGGRLAIKSTISVGTTVKCVIPIAKSPEWFDLSINYNRDFVLGILVTDSHDVDTWQLKLSQLEIKANYFINATDFIKWYQANNANKLILFFSYRSFAELENILNAISIKRTDYQYVVADCIEDFKVQHIISMLQIRLIYKPHIPLLKFNYVIDHLTTSQ